MSDTRQFDLDYAEATVRLAKAEKAYGHAESELISARAAYRRAEDNWMREGPYRHLFQQHGAVE